MLLEGKGLGARMRLHEVDIFLYNSDTTISILCVHEHFMHGLQDPVPY